MTTADGAATARLIVSQLHKFLPDRDNWRRYAVQRRQKGIEMFVDTALLQMGAGFSQSAAEIVARGADRFASAQSSAGAFGDFDAAHRFHNALREAHLAHISSMQGHRAGFVALADDANSAAAIFAEQDETSGSALDFAASALS